MRDIADALSAGWRDFRRAPAFGLLFTASYVLGGMVIAEGLENGEMQLLSR